ncbi:hypothetical protein PLESTB_001292300 [Pleodorina starrii]|uniref:Uncharacterized protein n=1 Tax=Pleodorina starrii TaxID=330485 RepID=A0A9W6F6C1_9CHLO|nr:hypothetical protein PLESTM_000956600 [Pleodorina starrii]GLC57943.1 hypothetical protein PLESTB_001292300 [Pleodorina starrii]
MSGPKPKAGQGVLLFEEEADEDATSDPHLKEKISKYLEEKTSKEPSKKLIHTGPDGEEHTGLTDDSADDEGEPDYDVASRMTLKASSEAFLEVMAEARSQYEKEKETARKKQAKAGAKESGKKP